MQASKGRGAGASSKVLRKLAHGAAPDGQDRQGIKQDNTPWIRGPAGFGDFPIIMELLVGGLPGGKKPACLLGIVCG